MSQKYLSVGKSKRGVRLALRGSFAAVVLMLSLPAQAQTKPTLTGLVAMGEINGITDTNWVPDNGLEEPYAHPETYNAVDINVTWAQLEPSNGGYNFSVITNALAAITTYNNANPTRPMKAKLRLYAGTNSPTWVLDLSSSATGTTYTGPVVLDFSGSDIDVPLFWTYEYHQAWQALQNQLAATFDGNSQIAEVSVSSCMSISGEPINLPIHNTTSMTNLHNKGYSDAQMKACLNYAASSSSTGDYQAWKNTPLYFAFSLYEDSDGSNNPPPSSKLDLPFTSGLIGSYRTAYGTRAVTGNNGLQDPLDSTNEVPLYNGETIDSVYYKGLKDYGPPIGFQAVSGNPPGGWNEVVTTQARNTYSATEMEIWQTTEAHNQDGTKGFASITQTQLNTYAGEAW